MSVWLSRPYAPFYLTWFLSGAILLGGIIVGRENTTLLDLHSRAIFILMMAIIALLAWEIRTNYASLETEVSERCEAQDNLQNLTKTLDERVSERTREISEVNDALTKDIAERKKVEAAPCPPPQTRNSHSAADIPHRFRCYVQVP